MAVTPSILAGIWRFTLVSVAGFAPWALTGDWLHTHLGESGLYSVCLLGFLLAAIVLLPGLLRGPRRLRRTAAYFIPAFITYAILWCTCWFTFGGRTGEWTGALIGGSAFALITALVLGRPNPLLPPLLGFVALHTGGYFSGDQVMHRLIAGGAFPAVGMLAWGICYGVGFGAGLGWLIHACQSAVHPSGHDDPQ